MTLVELLISMAVLALFLGIVTKVIGSYLRAYRDLDSSLPAVRSSAHCLESLDRLFSAAQRIYSPGLACLRRGYRPVLGKSAALKLAFLDRTGHLRLASVVEDPRLHAIVCSEAVGGKHERMVLGPASGLWLQVRHHARTLLLVVRLQPTVAHRLPFQTMVRLPAPVAFPRGGR